jgi:hypothetical protein
VGISGQAIHWDGTAWTRVPTGTNQILFGVAGNAEGVWVVGEGGSILKLRP